MNQHSKRVLALVTAFTLTVLLGCAPAKTPAPAGDVPKGTNDDLAATKATLTVLYPGDITNRMDEFLNLEFKEKMLSELNLEFVVSYSPWSQYFQKLDLMLASGEALDWYWNGTGAYPKHVAKKQCITLDELLVQYGPNIQKMIPAENLDAVRVGGKIYGIPSQAMPISDKFYTVLARTDLLDKVGIKTITNIAELDAACAAIKAKFPEITPISSELTRPLTRELAGDKDIRYCGSSGSLYVVENEDGAKVYDFLGNRELVQSIYEVMSDFNEKGYIPETQLTEPENHVTRFDNGNYFAMLGAILRPSERLNSVIKNAPGASLREFSLNPSRPRYKEMPGNEILFVSPNSKNPARCIQFFDWVWASKENFYFTVFGVEGKDFAFEDGQFTRINNDDLWYDWMFNNREYAVFPGNVNPGFLKDMETWDSEAKQSKMFGFSFDSEPVKAEQAKIESVYKTRIAPMLSGFGEFEETYAQAIKELQAAGIETYRAEFERQLTRYIASK